MIYNYKKNRKTKNTMEKKSGCKSCKKEGLGKSEWILLIFSLYIFAASVYGTIQFIKNFF